MNREIKFRMYRKSDKTMFQINPVWFEENNWHYDDFSKCAEEEDCVLMQYTGLQDNTKWDKLTEIEQKDWLDGGKTKEEWNGKEIYEGDIGKFTKYDGDEDRLFRVEWKNGGFFPLTMYVLELEIIGNIYSNPELILNI